MAQNNLTSALLSYMKRFLMHMYKLYINNELLYLQTNALYKPFERTKGRIPEDHKKAQLLDNNKIQIKAINNEYILNNIIDKLAPQQVAFPIPNLAIGATLTDNNDLVFIVKTDVLKPWDFFELIHPICFDINLISNIPKKHYVFCKGLGDLFLKRFATL